MSELLESPSEPVAALTAPIPVLPPMVLRASQSPHALGLWGRRLGESDLHLFPLGLGSGRFGHSLDDAAAADILDRFVDLDGNFVDATGTAADARSESLIGGWLRRTGRRGDVLLGTTIGNHHDLSSAPAQVITTAVDAALGRLATDHLDLLSIRLDSSLRADEVLVAIDDLARAGKVRYGAADAPGADQLIEARVVAAQSGMASLVAAQGSYSLLHRDGYEPDVSRVVALQGCGFMPRHPLAGGLLTGRQHSRHDVARLMRRGLVTTLPPRRRAALVSALGGIGSELGVAESAVALAWLLTRPGVTAPIVNISDVTQLESAMSAVRLQLTRQQASDLDRLSAL